MKYLKGYKLFESDGVDYYDGLTKEDIEDMFIDVSDMGFKVNVILDKKMVIIDKDWKIGNTRTTFGKIPYIRIKIYLISDTNTVDELSEINKKIKDISESEEFDMIIDEVNNRISEKGWYISDVSDPSNYSGVSQSPLKNSLEVFLHRKKDSKYI